MDTPLPSAPPGTSPASKEGKLERWLREARSGSPDALGRALEASRQYLLLAADRVLDQKLKPKVGASDLVQDTFLQAQKGFVAFRGQTEHEFHGWLNGILAHRLADNVRHYVQAKRRDVNRERLVESFEAAVEGLRDEAPTPGTSFLARDEQRRVQLALERLGEPWRSVLIERTWRGKTFAEIGAQRDCTADAARKVWARAVQKMQQILAEIE